MRKKNNIQVTLTFLVSLSFVFLAVSQMPDLMAQTDNRFLLTYPNLEDPDGRVVLENEHVVLQRMVVPAGEWEGIHSHPGNQLYVHIKGGEWSARLGGEPEYSGSVSSDGGVGWMDAIPLSAGHESGNTGDALIDLMWVTLKDDSPIAPRIGHLAQVYPDVSLDLRLENDRVIVQRGLLEPGQWTGVHRSPGNQIVMQIKGGNWSERRSGVEAEIPEFSEDGAVRWIDTIELGEAYEFGNTGNTTIDFVLITLK